MTERGFTRAFLPRLCSPRRISPRIISESSSTESGSYPATIRGRANCKRGELSSNMLIASFLRGGIRDKNVSAFEVVLPGSVVSSFPFCNSTYTTAPLGKSCAPPILNWRASERTPSIACLSKLSCPEFVRAGFPRNSGELASFRISLVSPPSPSFPKNRAHPAWNRSNRVARSTGRITKWCRWFERATLLRLRSF